MNTAVVALSQEDVELEKFALMPARISEGRFPILADLERASTTRWDRTTAYLIDREGKVRQIFPMIIHARPSWRVVRREIEQLQLVE